MPSKFPCLGQKKLKYNATYPCSNGFLQSFIKLRSHNSVFELFAGTKLMVASVVSVASALSSGRANPFVYAVLVSVGLAGPELNFCMTSTAFFFCVSILYAQQSLPWVDLTLLGIALLYADDVIEVLCNFGRR